MSGIGILGRYIADEAKVYILFRLLESGNLYIDSIYGLVAL